MDENTISTVSEVSDRSIAYEGEESYEAILPEGWGEGDDIFDADSWTGETGTDESSDTSAAAAEKEGEGDEATAGSTAAPTTEQAASTGDGTEGVAAEAHTESQTDNTPNKLRFTATFDHQKQDVELDEAELPTVYQKAQVTDRVQAKLAKLAPITEKSERLARLLGFDTVEAMLDAAEQNFRESEVDKLTGEGVHPEVASAVVDRKIQARVKSSASPAADSDGGVAAQPAQQPAPPVERDFRAEVAELIRTYPDDNLSGKPLPDEVIQNCVRERKPLVVAYADYKMKQTANELAALRKENNTLKHNAAAAQRAPVRGVTGGGATDTTPDDPFVKGFDSDGW